MEKETCGAVISDGQAKSSGELPWGAQGETPGARLAKKRGARRAVYHPRLVAFQQNHAELLPRDGRPVAGLAPVVDEKQPEKQVETVLHIGMKSSPVDP